MLEISDKFITNFNVFSYVILQFRFKTVWNISKPYCMTLKTVARYFCTPKVRNELLEMGKDMKIKHSGSSPPYRVWGTFFHRKALHGGTNVLGQFFLEMFYMGTNDQIMQGGELIVKRLERSSQVSFSSH